MFALIHIYIKYIFELQKLPLFLSTYAVSCFLYSIVQVQISIRCHLPSTQKTSFNIFVVQFGGDEYSQLFVFFPKNVFMSSLFMSYPFWIYTYILLSLFLFSPRILKMFPCPLYYMVFNKIQKSFLLFLLFLLSFGFY